VCGWCTYTPLVVLFLPQLTDVQYNYNNLFFNFTYEVNKIENKEKKKLKNKNNTHPQGAHTVLYYNELINIITTVPGIIILYNIP
jgi:hypothetical protein